MNYLPIASEKLESLGCLKFWISWWIDMQLFWFDCLDAVRLIGKGYVSQVSRRWVRHFELMCGNERMINSYYVYIYIYILNYIDTADTYIRSQRPLDVQYTCFLDLCISCGWSLCFLSQVTVAQVWRLANRLSFLCHDGGGFLGFDHPGCK